MNPGLTGPVRERLKWHLMSPAHLMTPTSETIPTIIKDWEMQERRGGWVGDRKRDKGLGRLMKGTGENPDGWVIEDSGIVESWNQVRGAEKQNI